MSSNAFDLIYLNNVTATVWLTVFERSSTSDMRFLISQKSTQAALLVPDLRWSLAPPASSNIAKSYLKSLRATPDHWRYFGGRHSSDFSTRKTLPRCAKSYASPRSSSSWLHHLMIYMLCIRIECAQIPENWSFFFWKCAMLKKKIATCKTCSSETVIFFWKFCRLLCWLPSSNAIVLLKHSGWLQDNRNEGNWRLWSH